MIKAGNATYVNPSDVSETIPVFPLTGALLLPGGQMPLNIFEPRYLSMVSDALQGDRLIGMVQPCLKTACEGHSPPQLSKIGCVGRITASQETGDGRLLISLNGVCRYRLVDELTVNTAYRQCEIAPFEQDFHEDSSVKDVDREALLSAFRNYLRANDMDADWDSIRNTGTDTLVTALCMMSPYDPAEKQALLEAPNMKERCETLIAISEFHLASNSEDSAGKLQ